MINRLKIGGGLGALMLIVTCLVGCQVDHRSYALYEPYGETIAADVQVFSKAPYYYQELGVVRAPSIGRNPRPERIAQAVDELRRRAAAMGANGVIVSGLGAFDGEVFAQGYGVGPASPLAKPLMAGPISGVAVAIP